MLKLLKLILEIINLIFQIRNNNKSYRASITVVINFIFKK